MDLPLTFINQNKTHETKSNQHRIGNRSVRASFVVRPRPENGSGKPGTSGITAVARWIIGSHE
jgi:hypothetical protein